MKNICICFCDISKEGCCGLFDFCFLCAILRIRSGLKGINGASWGCLCAYLWLIDLTVLNHECNGISVDA